VVFEPFLKESMQPEIRAYLDLEKFKVFIISFGNLIGNDYSLCFPIEDLYSSLLDAFDDSKRMVAEDTPRCRKGS
jgi:hypothetical protein